MPQKTKRDDVVQTAYELFNRHGYRAVGIDRIIAEAAVAKMMMYRHFPSKDDLVVAVLEDRARRFDRALDAVAERCSSPLEELSTIVEWYRDWFARPTFFGCAFVRALSEYDEEGTGGVVAAATAQKTAFGVRMQRIARDLGRPPAEARALGAALLTAVEGSTVLAQTGSTDEAAAALRLTVESLLGAPLALR